MSPWYTMYKARDAQSFVATVSVTPDAFDYIVYYFITSMLCFHDQPIHFWQVQFGSASQCFVFVLLALISKWEDFCLCINITRNLFGPSTIRRTLRVPGLV
ncbi:hypothetical protein H257_14664 [Aphanomyces astaci]|uniref:Uncharacterized protein n=1 Tax=Aphanomyces astaci TaxID=112090 RepID=W4FRR8_APHAT|nr:hypothetical protein H257_14664 [Aphanomyces astaci]ETV69641.1 hypothetical protein H257_14664 [Aphanomyces astaci]|eukprot:XP_009840857.1 hypothetical protein H257_14664 [Aphanomyces astaci]